MHDDLIRIDALVEGFAVEEFGQHFLDLRNTGRAADEDDLVDLVFRDLGVLDHDLDRVQALLEDFHAELLELVAVYAGFVVLSIGEFLALNRSRVSLRKSFLGLHAQIS